MSPVGDKQAARPTILQAVATAAERFLSVNDWRLEIKRVLSVLGQATGVSRAYLRQNSQHHDRVQVTGRTIQWHDGQAPRPRKNSGADNFGHWLANSNRWIVRLRRGKTVLAVASKAPQPENGMMEAAQVCSMLVAPIFVDGDWWGYIGLEDCHREHVWADDEVEALVTTARLVGAAEERRTIFNSISERYEAERQQKHLAYLLHQVGIKLTGTLELNQVLAMVLEQAYTIVPYDTATFMLVEGEQVRIVSSRGYDQLGSDLQHNVEQLTFQLSETPNLSVMAKTRQPYLVPDTTQDPSWQWVDAGRHIRSWLGAPVVIANDVVGFISVDKMDVGYYTSDHAEWLSAFAGQAALALQNANLYADVIRRAEQAELLRQASSAVASALHLDEVLDRILVNLRRVVPYDSAAIFLSEEVGIRIVAARGFAQQAALLDHIFPMDDELSNLVMSSGDAIILADALADERFNAWGGVSHTHGWIGVPLISGGQTIGLMTIDHHEVGFFTPEDARLVQAFAGEVSIAIEKARLFTEVQRLAITDPLTGLYNQRYFYEAGERELKRALKHQHPLSLIIADIDLFKQVNDTYGHQAGDQMLRRLAAALAANLRQVDILARYGGEEFAILLPETNEQGACIVAHKLREAAAAVELNIRGQMVHVSISQGVAELQLEGETLEKLFLRADQALYHTKQVYRGQISLWSQSDQPCPCQRED
ncbi:MAG: diguanylate cyclase [Anaerolineae bacterium]|nr:diguanylate cyclase [Anaerolineae bacterium]